MNRIFAIQTRGLACHDFTHDVSGWLSGLNAMDGLLTLMVRHTSCSLLIQENAAPAARRDMERYLARITPESRDYEHDDEGPDDMPAHLKSLYRPKRTRTSTAPTAEDEEDALLDALEAQNHR